MKEFKLIVAGSRSFDNYELLVKELNHLANVRYADREVSIVSGMAKGADQLAVDFAREYGVKLYPFPADWNTYGKAAGFYRNELMGNFAHGLLAFWDGKSHGTKHMIEYMRFLNKPVHIVPFTLIDVANIDVANMNQFSWRRYGGYECSSKGDKRFSALFARMPDGRTIEQHYQCDVKGYDPGGTNWRLGKSKPPLNPETDLWAEYLALWEQWALAHPDLMTELGMRALEKNGVLSDMFATTDISQARALATILNKYWKN